MSIVHDDNQYDNQYDNHDLLNRKKFDNNQRIIDDKLN